MKRNSKMLVFTFFRQAQKVHKAFDVFMYTAGIRGHGGRQILEVYGRKSLWAQPLNLLTWFTPLVVIRNIFSFLDSRSLARVSRVCVQLRGESERSLTNIDIASDNLLWKNLCVKDFMVHPKFELQNFKSHYIYLRKFQ